MSASTCLTGKTLLVEIKRPGGKVSAAQTSRHASLAALGHPVTVAFLSHGAGGSHHST